MKKNIFLTVCFAVMGILSVNAQNGVGTIALHHEGKVTLYAGGETQVAMDASVKGDTLYLSEGMFAGFNVTHGIVIIGAGENTKVTSNITIVGNTENKDLGDYVFKGLNLNNDFVVNDSVKGFRMIQCRMMNFTVNNFMDEAVVNMSYIRNYLDIYPLKVNGLTFAHSKIYNGVHGGGSFSGAASFYHCNVRENTNSYSLQDAENNTFINCIVYEANRGTYMNCLYNKSSTACTYYGSYQDTKLSFDNTMNCSYSDEELKSKGYLGNDSTVVGITGGDSPYTLELFTPHIVEHKLDMDQVTRTLKVTLKMSSEANKNDE